MEICSVTSLAYICYVLLRPPEFCPRGPQVGGGTRISTARVSVPIRSVIVTFHITRTYEDDFLFSFSESLLVLSSTPTRDARRAPHKSTRVQLRYSQRASFVKCRLHYMSNARSQRVFIHSHRQRKVSSPS